MDHIFQALRLEHAQQHVNVIIHHHKRREKVALAFKIPEGRRYQIPLRWV